MVLLLNEKKAKKVYSNYPKGHVIALTFGKNTSLSLGEDTEIDYQTLDFIPDEDVINGVISGDIKEKLVIKKAIKAINNPSENNYTIGVGMIHLVTMLITPRYSNNHYIDNVLIIVKDAENKARNKFLTRYFKALFNAFGIRVGDENLVDKLFSTVGRHKRSKKNNKKNKSKNIKTIANFVEAKPEYIGRNSNAETTGVYKINFNFYKLEMYLSDISRLIGSGDRVSDDFMKKVAKCFIHSYTNSNLKAIDSISMSYKRELKHKVDIDSVHKKLVKKNKKIFNAYMSFKEIVEALQLGNNGKYDLPEVKYGSKTSKKKKNKGKKNKIPKMTKTLKGKFMRYFKKNPKLLCLLCSHTVTILFGVEIGSAEYNETMTDIGSSMNINMKSFISTAKKYAMDNANTNT